MKKLNLFIAFLVALLAFSLSTDAQTSPVRKLAPTFDGVGQLKIGMTAAQAVKVLGVKVTRNAGYEENSCYYTSPQGAYRDLSFMMSGQRIVRIDVRGKAFTSDKGAKTGDTEARIKQLYKGLYKISPHTYIDGHYIEIAGKGKKYSLLFETDGRRVLTFRIGLTEPVGYVEGCS